MQTISVGIEFSNNSNVTDFELTNYPNPFNPATSISFDLSTGSNVKLTVFNSTGKEVASLINGNLNRGKHQVSFNAGNMVSGVYYYSLSVDGKSVVKKMMLLK